MMMMSYRECLFTAPTHSICSMTSKSYCHQTNIIVPAPEHGVYAQIWEQVDCHSYKAGMEPLLQTNATIDFMTKLISFCNSMTIVRGKAMEDVASGLIEKNAVDMINWLLHCIYFNGYKVDINIEDFKYTFLRDFPQQPSGS